MKKLISIMILTAASVTVFAGSVGQIMAPSGGVMTTIYLGGQMEPPVDLGVGYALNCSIQNPKAGNVVAIALDDSIVADNITLNGEHMFSYEFKTHLNKGQNNLTMNFGIQNGDIDESGKPYIKNANLYVWSTTADVTFDCVVQKISCK